MQPIPRIGLRRMRRRLGAWLDHLAPRGCALCDAPLPPGAFAGFCSGCLADLPGARRARCGRCAHPTDRPADACSRCADPIPVGMDATLTAADYAPPLDRVVTTLKFGRRLALATPLGRLLAARWLGQPHAIPLDRLVPVPLGTGRLASRGFNQSLEIARAMSAALSRPPPVLATALLRLRDTPSQAGLALADRQRNLEGCFASTMRFDGLTIGLVDDVMTSGSTVSEAARALKAAGAQRVIALVSTRTP